MSTLDKQTIAKTVFPASLTTLRLAIAPALVMLAYFGAPRLIFVFLVVTAFLSDWLDGVVARRLGVVTNWLRRYDIVADVTFYLAVIWAVWVLEPNAVEVNFYQFMALLVLEATCQIAHLSRFRCLIATHAYLCKFWAIFLAITAIAILGCGVTGQLLQATFIIGYIAYLDVFLILVLSRTAPVDVISSYHVWLIEKRERTV